MGAEAFAAISQIDTSQIGSVGSLMGAALETAGHYMQSILLDMLANGVANSIGTLIFLIALISALLIVAIGGEYKYGLWFFIGPPLFVWLITVRVPSTGANWQFGERSYSKTEVYRATQDLFDPQQSNSSTDNGARQVSPTVQRATPQVSLFFKWWDQFTSNLVQNFVGVLQISKHNFEKNFVSKFEVYDAYLQQDITDPNLRAFLGLALVKECSRYFMLVRELNNPAIDRPRKELISDELEKIAKTGNKTFSFQSYPALKQWLMAYPDFSTLVGKLNTNLQREKLDTIPPDLGGTMSCNALWQLSILVVNVHAKDLIENLAQEAAKGGVGMSRADIIEELTRRYEFGIDHKDGFDVSAEEKGQKVQVYREILTGEQKLLLLINELVARLIVKQFSNMQPDLADMPKDYTPDAFKQDELGRTFNEDTARRLQLTMYQESFKGKGDFLSAMLVLPYVQGLGLFFLSLSFPLFMFSMIVPGRHHGVFVWCGLWFWLKLWDFGFAVVMLIDDLLYSLLPSAPPIVDGGLNHPFVNANPAQLENPGQVFRAVLEVDPSYSIYIYYKLIATCLAAVPVLTAVLCSRSGAAITDVINQTFRNFAGRIGEALASHQRSLRSQTNAAQVQENIYNSVGRALDKAFNDPEVIAAFGKENAFRAGKEIFKDMGRGQSGLTKFLPEMMSGLSDAARSQQQQIALTKFQANLTMAAYYESTNANSREMSTDAVMLRYYQHDFCQAYPVMTQIEVLKARYNLPFAKAIDKAPGDVVSGGFNAFNAMNMDVTSWFGW